MGDFRRVGSSGAAAPGIGLANVPRKSDSHPSPARVQNRLKELQALCTSDCEALLFVAGDNACCLFPPSSCHATETLGVVGIVYVSMHACAVV
jgi:hypothetical protein